MKEFLDNLIYSFKLRNRVIDKIVLPVSEYSILFNEIYTNTNHKGQVLLKYNNIFIKYTTDNNLIISLLEQ